LASGQSAALATPYGAALGRISMAFAGSTLLPDAEIAT
jgi:hypothetical protein